MSKKKKHEHVNHERWLVSYADFITLLFAFFVVLFASGQADKKKQQKFASAMQQAFSQMALFEPHAKQPALNDGSGANPNAAPKPIEMPLQAEGAGDTPERVREKVEKLVESEVGKGGLKKGDVTTTPTAEGLVLSLHEGGFFDSGSAALKPAATETLKEIAGILPGGQIRVEGHTDNLPMRSAMYASNWELSSARASAIARFLLEHSSVNPSHLAVAGYAEFHPVASNGTVEGRAANRRVDVVFLK